VNDNSPQFRDSEIQLAIIEAAQVGSTYILPTATDDDSPDNGVQRYELDLPPQSAAKFALDVGTKLDGAAEVKLRLSDRVDRETQAEYRLRLRAVDGGTPTQRTGTLDIVVAILDSNDNRPVFTSDQYELTVVENAPVGYHAMYDDAVNKLSNIFVLYITDLFTKFIETVNVKTLMA